MVFKFGMFSNSKELQMDINITFRNKQMLTSFLDSFHTLGYTSKDYRIIDNTFVLDIIYFVVVRCGEELDSQIG